MPQIKRQWFTICTTICDELTFTLFILRAKAIDESASFPFVGSLISSSHSLATSRALVRIVWRMLETSARRRAVGGVWPGLARACVRTKARARFTAFVAIPSQQLAQRMCEKGTCVWLATSANGSVKI